MANPEGDQNAAKCREPGKTKQKKRRPSSIVAAPAGTQGKPMSQSPAFADLLARGRAGDAAALDELMRQYEPEVRLVARLRLGAALRPYLDSMDLVQSVHRSLLVGLKQDKYELKEPGHLVALALTIVRRKAARHWRRLQKQDRPSDGASSDKNLPAVLRNLADSVHEPGESYAAEDTYQKIAAGLAPDEKQLLDLHLQGLRTVEIAERLGQNADVLRVRLSRLRAKLRASGVADE